MEIIEKVKEFLEPIANERKYYIVEVTYKREGSKPVLRILVDKAFGITIDECARLNNQLSELLDKENIIEEQYMLEVSSPGLDRKLKTDQDFVWAIGKKIKVNMNATLNGKRTFQGLLLGLGNGTIVIDKNGTSQEIPREIIRDARLVFEKDRARRGQLGGDRCFCENNSH